MFSKFFERIGFPFPLNDHISACVSRLFCFRGPPAILFTIHSIIVDSINRCSFRFWPHVIKECRKVTPPWIVKNPTTAIAVVFIMTFVVASLSHAYPTYIGGMIYSTNAVGPSFWLGAPAASAFTVSQGNAKNFAFRSALATAKIIDCFFPISSMQNKPLPENHSSNVYVWHGNYQCGCDAVILSQWLPNGIKSCGWAKCKDRWERDVYRRVP